MPKKSNKNITLNDLAVMMAKGFAEMVTKAEFNDLRADFKKEISRLD